ncbi:hypothetical protein AB0B48_02085 [Micromonospora sp. NPDC049089]|uniref:hypothetical protein n=1 Tax=Micromonospora sp. NPDC049089 TaxID=3155496 RepID=UPI0033E3B739
MEEQHRWLRDKRHQVYESLVRESSHFAAELVPLIDMAERVWNPESELFKSRGRYFELLYKASFLASDALQLEIRRAGDLAENVGHQPWDDMREKSRYESEWLREAFDVARAIEDAARAELDLPPRRREAREG